MGITHYCYIIRNILNDHRSCAYYNIFTYSNALAYYSIRTNKCSLPNFHISAQYCARSDVSKITNDTFMINAAGSIADNTAA